MRKMVVAFLAVALLLSLVLVVCNYYRPAQTGAEGSPGGNPGDTGFAGDRAESGAAVAPGSPAGGSFTVDRCNSLAVYMVDASTGWKVTQDSILRTNDGGSEWTDVTPPFTSGADEAALAGAALLGRDRGWLTVSREGGGVSLLRVRSYTLRTMEPLPGRPSLPMTS